MTSHGVASTSRARICKPFKEPRNRFLAWRAGTTTLFDIPARQATFISKNLFFYKTNSGPEMSTSGFLHFFLRNEEIDTYFIVRHN